MLCFLDQNFSTKSLVLLLTTFAFSTTCITVAVLTDQQGPSGFHGHCQDCTFPGSVEKHRQGPVDMSELDGEPRYGVLGLLECRDKIATGSPSQGTSIEELHCSAIECT